jgi:hypothetical protein
MMNTKYDWGGTSLDEVRDFAARLSFDDIERIIVNSTTLEQKIMLSVAQLMRSYWVRGESVKRSPNTHLCDELLFSLEHSNMACLISAAFSLLLFFANLFSSSFRSYYEVSQFSG